MTFSKSAFVVDDSGSLVNPRKLGGRVSCIVVGAICSIDLLTGGAGDSNDIGRLLQ